MKVPKVLILRTAGTNCDVETATAFKLAGGDPVLVHVRELIGGKVRLFDYAVIAIPGGFSYGDDISAGRVLANELRGHVRDLRSFVRSGRPVIGICNGFQVLVKAGLLPQTPSGEQTASLTVNDSNRFESRWVRLRINLQSQSLFTRDLPEMIELPVAHGEGKFVVKSPKVLETLKKTRAILMQYVNEEGKFSSYPHNPNGSLFNIAAITNPEGNCLGIMPHPERYLTRYHHPNWTRQTFCKEGIGLEIFRNAVRFVKD
ncbi:MAG: phosphoribosylformylglycinamidine synthase I [Elusimicrobia bacterium GWA2_69_24]|nr:MAG: phosphoribosylformylglycinamidine synthase I [Elusimicrobia bacterium GWA2_69_24]HBL17235.1 phosphoribosylformylglycinamidine synthase I [Elusimicrobiota bacterium]